MPMLDASHSVTLGGASASLEEAAAVVAAIEQFVRATTPAPGGPREAVDPWQRAALIEGVSRAPQDEPGHPWINT